MSHYQRVGMILVTSLLLIFFFRQLHAQSDTSAASVAVVRGQGAFLLDDTGQQLKGALTAGSLVTLIARSSDSGLLYVESETNGSGWVTVGSLLTASVNTLPVRLLGSNVETESTITQNENVTQTTSAEMAILVPTPTPTPATIPLTTGAEIMSRVEITDSRLNLPSGPGTQNPIVEKTEPNSTWQVTGRNEAGDWIQIINPVTHTPVWAATTFLTIISGTLDAAMVITELPLLPTPTATTAGVTNVAPEELATSSSVESVKPVAVSSTNAASVGVTGLSGTLVFQDRNGGTIYVYDLGNDTLRSLTSGVDPAISNDGRMVTFTRDGGGMGVYVINLDGSGERLLYNEHEILRSPKWSPDDQWIVFSRSAGYVDCRALHGGVCLPDDDIWESLPPDLQTGESRNDIRGLPNQREYFFALSRIGLDGEGYRDIPALTKAQAPDWNEAGITYFSSMAGIQITADSGDAQTVEVANDAILGYFQDPDWQPGGGRIAFQRQMNGQHWQIFIVNPDGSGLAAITRPVTALVDELPSNVSPAWSPDGQHIVYLSSRSSIESAGAWHLWVMNADGSEQSMLPIDVPLDYTFSAEQVVSWGPAQ